MGVTVATMGLATAVTVTDVIGFATTLTTTAPATWATSTGSGVRIQ